MERKKKIQGLRYVLSDFISSAIAWFCFYSFRKLYLEPHKFGHELPFELDANLFGGVILIPAAWILLYYIVGYYNEVYRKSRLHELGDTLQMSLFGCIAIFFILVLDDAILSYKDYYTSFFVLYGLQFCLNYIPRCIITNRTVSLIRNRRIGFNTILVGSNERAKRLYNEIENQPKSIGNKFVGFVNVYEKDNFLLSEYLSCLGRYENLIEIIKEKKIEEVIIAIETSEQDEINKIISLLEKTNVKIKVIPKLYDILTGSVKMSTFYGVPLIEITHDLMPAWQINLKRIIDVVLSIVALIVLIPVYIIVIIAVKTTSKGSIFYSHERIGRFGKPFHIYKFRSMYVGSEKNGPALSSKNDSRITPFGKFMRKTRIDELPQFYNVLKGDMALVGPRPERQFFIDQIVEKAPYYLHLQKVRPGITSWGQVKYGYAENVDEMVERLSYDIIYIENMSLYADLKIMIYTIKTVFQGSGK